MAEETNNRVKVIGYAQRTFYDDGIEYRNFADNLVGQQFTEDGGTALFTSANFNVSVNLNPRITREFYTGKYTEFFNLQNLNVTEAEEKLIIENTKLKLRLDKTNLRNYAYYGSLIEYIRVSLEDVIIDWPASLYLTSNKPFSVTTGNTIQDYSYNALEKYSTFKVPTDLIRNKFQINYLTNGITTDSFSDTNDLRNLTVNYLNYVLTIDDIDYPVIDFAGAASSTTPYIYLKVNGNPITGSTSSESYHIRPSKYKREEFFNYLGDFESHLLNRFVTPKYTANFRFPVTTDSGVVLYKQENLTWPTTDGYNIDFDTLEYTQYISSLLDIGKNQDENLSDYMVRLLVAESISDFDTVQKCDNSLEETSGQKMTSTLRIYGREFDEIKRKIDGIQYANTVTYDKQNNTPDVILKNVARTLGWELTSSMMGNDLLQNYLDIQESSYSGDSRGLTPVEAEYELWRRLIMNSAWIWKSKGTRKSIEFLFRFIGAPEGLITLNEYLYITDNKIDTELLQAVLEKQNLATDLDLYNVDTEGYPKAFDNTSEMYFQKGGNWYRETGGSGSTKHILTGNNPHAGPYDGGKAYKSQFETLIPNFSAVTITEETITNETTNIFTNYNSGFFNELVDDTVYLSLVDIDTIVNSITPSIIDDPQPTAETTDCGCETGAEDRSLLLEYDLNASGITTTTLFPKLNNGVFYIMEDDETCVLNLQLDYLIKFDCDDLITYATTQVPYVPPCDVVGLSQTLATFTSGTSEYVTAETARDECWVIVEADLLSKGVTLSLIEYLASDASDALPMVDNDISNVFEDLELYWNLEINHTSGDPTIVAGGTLFNIDDFQTYITENKETGIYLSGSNCNSVTQRVLNSLGDDCDLVTDTTLNSTWLRLNETITDESILSAITDERISISITNNTGIAINYGLMIDRIEMNKECTETQIVDSTITTSPGFEIYKMTDNKKSWVASDARDNREFELRLRDTNYNINHHKLGINNKEIDLNFDYAKPIECDLFSYYTQCPFEDNSYSASCLETQSQGTPIDTNIYAFYDSTSMGEAEATQASTSMRTWFAGFKNDNPDYGGEFYELVIHDENWLGWATYPMIGTLAGSSSPAELDNRSIYQNINNLPPGASATTTTFKAGPAAWAGGDANAIVIMVIDESNSIYHGSDIPSDTPHTTNFTSQPHNKYTIDYEIFLNNYQSYNFFKGFIYPRPTEQTSGIYCNFILHVAGAIEGELVPVTATDRIPVNDICSDWLYDAVTREAPYSALSQTAAYQSLPASLQNGAGLKKFGWGTDYNVIDFTVEQFSLSLDNFLLGTELPVSTDVIVVSTGTTNPVDFLSIDPTDTSLVYEEFLEAYSTELIDVKSRKIMPAYPLLRKIYDDYLNEDLRCISKNPLNYEDTIDFGKLVDNFWVDLVEQVMPSTAMWDSTYVYRNSMFDAAKTQYRKYTLFNGDDLGALPFDPIAVSENVQLITIDVTNLEDNPICAQVTTTTATTKNVAIAQMDCGSEFYGSWTVIGGEGEGEGESYNNCELTITSMNDTISDGVIYLIKSINGIWGDLTYAWTITSVSGTINSVSFIDTGNQATAIASPQITYNGEGGVISVSLTVTDDICSNTATHDINV